MDGLASVAQMAVYLSQKEENEETMDEENASLLAAAVSNYLFGRTPGQDHIDQFTLEKIEYIGNELIKNSESIRELVIQSLRVISAVSVAVGKEEVGMEILSTYGKNYPQSPDPENFTQLVNESIRLMSPNVQQTIAKMQQ